MLLGLGEQPSDCSLNPRHSLRRLVLLLSVCRNASKERGVVVIFLVPHGEDEEALLPVFDVVLACYKLKDLIVIDIDPAIRRVETRFSDVVDVTLRPRPLGRACLGYEAIKFHDKGGRGWLQIERIPPGPDFP